ncbi:MAG TPA: hypothetical protein GX707_16855 [Epulopiscium sp.]|nr:hypothetical protein [Candidatus Epulonipiscium sp.]
MVPLRFIAEAFGCEVDYKDRIVVITQKQINKEFKQFKANMAIITEDVTLQDPYVVTEDSNNKLIYQKINNDVFSLRRNDMVIVIEEYDTKCRIMQAFGDLPLVRGTIEKSKLSYDTSLFKDNANQAIVNDAMSYDGINGKKEGVQYGVGRILERKGEWAKISLPMEERDYWFKSDSLSNEFDTTVVDYVR